MYNVRQYIGTSNCDLKLSHHGSGAFLPALDRRFVRKRYAGLTHADRLLKDSLIKVYKCSSESTLICLPKVSYGRALAQ